MKKAHSILRRGRSTDLPVARILLIIAAFVVLSVGSIITSRAYADSQGRTIDSRVVTLYDRGVEQSFVTTASTVKGALDEAGIEIDRHDRVEPSLDEALVANEYAVNVYRARPLLIVDGAMRHVVVTAAQVPEQIAKDAGLVLYPEDITKLEQSNDLLADRAAERFIVTRALVFNLKLYGETLTARTQAKTVGEMLKQKNIILGANDRTSLPLHTSMSSNMDIQVWREGKQTVTRDEATDFEIDKIQDANRPAGYREVKTPGEKGVRTVTYEVLIRDGHEVERKEIASIEKTAAKRQVEIIGTKVAPISGTCSEWMAAAGVVSTNNVNYLISKESGCNPRAVNRSSGACGIGQALPCSKMGGVNPDGTSALSPVDQMRWMNSYVMGRYGSWDAAAAHHRAKGWY